MPNRQTILWAQRRVRLVLIVLAALAGGVLTWFLLAPHQFRKKSVDYKFMHCTTCGLERPYEAAKANERCMKCQPPKVGYYEPTEHPVGANGRSNPWRWFNIAIGVEVLALLGTLFYTLRPVKDKEKQQVHWRCSCPHCNWRLRFRASLAGKSGQCPRCRRFFHFPTEDAEIEESEPVS